MNSATPVHEQQRSVLDFIKSMYSVAGAALTLLAAFPAASLFLPFVVPPWPDNAWIIGIIMIVSVSCLTFLSCRDEESSSLLSRSNKIIIPLIVCVVVTVVLAALFIENGSEFYILKGISFSDEARMAINNGAVSSDTAKDLLNAFGFDSPDRIWRGRWLTKALTSLSYAATAGLMAHLFSVYVLASTPIPQVKTVLKQ